MSNSSDFALEILVKRILSNVCFLSALHRLFQVAQQPVESCALTFFSNNKELVCDKETEVGLKYAGIEPLGEIIQENCMWWIHALQTHDMKSKQAKPLEPLRNKIFSYHFIGILETEISTAKYWERNTGINFNKQLGQPLGLDFWPSVEPAYAWAQKSRCSVCVLGPGGSWAVARHCAWNRRFKWTKVLLFLWVDKLTLSLLGLK